MAIIHIIGFLGADPEERYTNAGQKVWTLRLAERSYKNGQEDTIWWRLTVWGDQYDKFLSHCKKGKPLNVVAEMNKLEIYTDKNQQPQVSYDATVKSLFFLPNSERVEGQQQNKQDGQHQNFFSGVQTGYNQNQNNYGGYNQGNSNSNSYYAQSEASSSNYAQPAFSTSSSEDEPLPF